MGTGKGQDDRRAGAPDACLSVIFGFKGLRFLPPIEKLPRKHKRQAGAIWRMDEAYIKTKGARKYLYCAVDKEASAWRDWSGSYLITSKMGKGLDARGVTTPRAGCKLWFRSVSEPALVYRINSYTAFGKITAARFRCRSGHWLRQGRVTQLV